MTTDAMLSMVRAEMAAAADPAAVAAMAAYLKTDMPFYGVKRPARRPIERRLKREFPPADAGAFEANVLALWDEPQREVKHLAIAYAKGFATRLPTPERLPLYERLIREGAWWDLVDDVAANLVGGLLLRHRPVIQPILDGWADDEDMWIRRTALISQLKHKADTDAAWLFDLCRRRAHEREFFIRKAIGWALRQYARTDADAVRGFLAAHGEALSGLSRREASKHL